MKCADKKGIFRVKRRVLVENKGFLREKTFSFLENICTNIISKRKRFVRMILRIGEEEHKFGNEIQIETDGESVIVRDGEMEICEEGSPLEILYIISWFMRAADKTKLVMKAGETEFVRKRKYRLGALKLYGKHKDENETDKNS